MKVSFDVIGAHHLVDLFHWRNDPSIMEWTRQNDFINWEEHEAWYKKMCFDKTMRMYLIKIGPNSANNAGKPAGVCGLTSMDLLNQRAEFSLYIAPGWQGKGYGRDALYMLCQHGFNTYNLKTIWGESFEGNPAMRMFYSMGFKEEGIRRNFYFRNGKHINAHLFSVTKEELKWK